MEQAGIKSHNKAFKPLTIDEALVLLNKVKRQWGGSTIIGVTIAGNEFVMPCIEIRTPKTKARCTIVATPTELMDKLKDDIT